MKKYIWILILISLAIGFVIINTNQNKLPVPPTEISKKEQIEQKNEESQTGMSRKGIRFIYDESGY